MQSMNKQIAIVVSQFNQNITEELLKGALEHLAELGIKQTAEHVFKVPGAVEIPLTAKLLAMKKIYDVIICLGAVIRGETSHYDYVCQQVSQGCQTVMLDYNIPIVFGVLTTDTVEQAEERAGGLEGNKGKDAAQTAIDMLHIVDRITSSLDGTK